MVRGENPAQVPDAPRSRGIDHVQRRTRGEQCIGDIRALAIPGEQRGRDPGSIPGRGQFGLTADQTPYPIEIAGRDRVEQRFHLFGQSVPPLDFVGW